MKITRQSLLVAMIPLLAQTMVLAEPKPNPEPLTAATAETKGVAASWRASEIIGVKVKNASDETIGEVEDLIVDLISGEILAVVISSGGFLGMADTLSTVPTSAIRYEVTSKSFKTKLTREQLVKAPNFKKTEWPNYSEETTRSKLRAFRDSLSDDVNAPDNTARNEREVKLDELNPTDQGNSESDLKTTKNIRNDIIHTELSFDAKNIKVITKDGKVTLKGVVKDHSEHEAILKIAKNHVEAANLTDDLKMKNK